MKLKNIAGTSIAEVMVIMLIITAGITGVYSIYNESIKISDTTGHRIQAIQIAREGIEAITNIRDTNWMLFSPDPENCWNTLNYSGACIGNSGIDHRIRRCLTGPCPTQIYFKVSTNTNNRWELTPIEYTSANATYENTSFRNDFKVGYDANGMYTQSGSVQDTTPLFTRYVYVNYPVSAQTSDSMNVFSVVEWADRSGNHSVELETLLTNWKQNN